MFDSNVTGLSKQLLLMSVRLANAVYTLEQIDKENVEVIYKSNSNFKFFPVFSLCVSKGSMFVAIRGTDSPTDWATNFNFSPIYKIISKKNVSFHSGYYKSAINILDVISMSFKKFRGPIYFVGHSYGGSVATIMCALMLARHPERDFNAIAFGPTPCASELPEYIKKKIISIVLSTDVVTTLSLSNAYKKFGKMDIETLTNKVSLAGRTINIAFNDTASKFLGEILWKNANIIANCIKRFVPQENDVKIPSGIVVKVGFGKGKGSIKLADEHALEDINFNLKSIVLHSASFYQYTISSVQSF